MSDLFHGFGKVTFLKLFYQHAAFISSGLEYPGSLADINGEDQALGLYGKGVRLVFRHEMSDLFHGFGKVTFLKLFYQHAAFISSGLQYPGSLADINGEDQALGFLAFLRLVGTAYFKANLGVFTQRTPQALFNSLYNPTLSMEEQHEAWLDMVRSTCWVHVASPSEEVPSTDALRLHWMRSIWVLHMWKQCLCNKVEL